VKLQSIKAVRAKVISVNLVNHFVAQSEFRSIFSSFNEPTQQKTDIHSEICQSGVGSYRVVQRKYNESEMCHHTQCMNSCYLS